MRHPVQQQLYNLLLNIRGTVAGYLDIFTGVELGFKNRDYFVQRFIMMCPRCRVCVFCLLKSLFLIDLNTLFQMVIASGPDILMTATPARGR
jgi:hypothetical protein